MADTAAGGGSQKCNNENGLTDNDKGTLGALWLGLTAAVTAYNSAQAVDFAMKQYGIAKRYARIAQWWLDYHKSYFRPVEDQEAAEAMALGDPEPHYDTAVGRAQVAGRIKFKGAAEKAAQCTSEYCTGLRAVLFRDMAQQEAIMVASLAGLGHRNERAYLEKMKDLRWKKLIAVVSRGRDMQADAINNAELAFGIYGSIKDQAGAGAAGAAAMFGYEWDRRQTYYPTLMRTMPGVQAYSPAPRAAPPGEPGTSAGYMDANGQWQIYDPARYEGGL